MRFALAAILLLVSAAGCARKIDVRVIDDATGRPVAGASVRPWLDDLLGVPYLGAAAVTDADGRARCRRPYGGARGGFDVAHPEYREFNHASDKPQVAGDVALLYVRRPPRVTLLLPPAYRGPVLVNRMSGFDPRQESFDIPIAADPLEPTPLPAGQVGDLVELDEIGAVRDGQRIPPAPDGADPATVYVWEGGPGAFYEDDYVQFLFVGTPKEFADFERAWRNAVGPAYPLRLRRDDYERMLRKLSQVE